MDGSTAAGDDSVASEKSSDIGAERSDDTPATAQVAQLRKTLSYSAKGILASGKLRESASGPMLPPGSPVSPATSPRCSILASTSQLPRESTGPLLLRRSAVPMPVAVAPPGAHVGAVWQRPARESSPPCHALATNSTSAPQQIWGQQLHIMRAAPPALQPVRPLLPVPQVVTQPVMQPALPLRARHSVLADSTSAAQRGLPAQAGCTKCNQPFHKLVGICI